MRFFHRVSGFFLVSIFSFFSLWAQGIQIVPAERGVEPEALSLKIVFPEEGELDRGNPVKVQLRLRGYPLGTMTQIPRADGLANSEEGQSIHIVIDDRPYFPMNGPSIDPYDEDGNYQESTYQFFLPFSLKPGMHVIRAFPTRSYGESLKGDAAFDSSYFFVRQKKYNREYDLRGPYITYNEPTDQLYLKEGTPILLDFLVSNCELSRSGYNIKVTIDQKFHEYLYEWRPYYIYGLKQGRHTIQMQLLDKKRKLVPGAFNNVKRTFQVH